MTKEVNWKNEEYQRLVESLLCLKNAGEAERFLRDLMTEGEITEFAKRLQAAEMLSAKIPYSTIERQTGFSSTTVARVSKWLNSGMGGYKEIIAKMPARNVFRIANAGGHHHNPSKLGKGLSLTRT